MQYGSLKCPPPQKVPQWSSRISVEDQRCKAKLELQKERRTSSGVFNASSVSYNMGVYLGKGTYWQCLHRFDCRGTTLSNAANFLKIFLIESEICLYKQLYFLYIRNPLFPIVVFISMLWQLKVNTFYPKNSFPIVQNIKKCNNF